jgi:hypothetical protein
MSNLDLQVVEVASLVAGGTDIMQRMECQEKDCKHVAPLSAFFVWRVWRESQGKWIYFPFCQDHVLTCVPTSAMGKG